MTQNIQEVLENAVDYARGFLYEGKVASYIPELAKADPSKLGVCLYSKEGEIWGVGDYQIPFTVQSVGKTFSLILALQTAGYEKVFSKVGVEPTGDKFDSIVQLEMKNWTPYNPMINAGAIATVGCIDTKDPFGDFLELMRELCDDPKIRLNEQVYLSEKRTGMRNRSIGYLLKNDHVIEGDVEDILDIYFRICSVLVTAKNLARYGLILANSGYDPIRQKQMIDPEIVQVVKTLMFLCGMYDESGEFAVKVGIPCKSGVGGGIVAATGNGMGIATFGPLLNEKGNSVGGKKILEYLSQIMGIHIFAPKISM